MKIKNYKIPIKKIVKYNTSTQKCEGYIDKGEEGVFGCDGKLNIRPSYQREFVYNDKQRKAVIHTIRKGFPLNVLYWVQNIDGNYEVLDGQQRLISIGQYVSGGFTINVPSIEDPKTTNPKHFYNLKSDEQKQILNYKLEVYFCEGTDSEKLDWFQIINIAGEKLTDQEIRNAIYSGPWVSDAKKYFSKIGCAAYRIASDYLRGSAIRQDYLETAINWINGGGNVEDYMSKHQHDIDAKDLWVYFERVIEWVKKLFPTYRREMKGVPFGLLYNKYKDKEYNPATLESEVSRLMIDEDVQKKSGIYKYVFDSDERHLNIRAFSENQKRESYESQQGICPLCSEEDRKKLDLSDMEADHITPWSRGGKTISENCQMLCQKCNRTKSNT